MDGWMKGEETDKFYSLDAGTTPSEQLEVDKWCDQGRPDAGQQYGVCIGGVKKVKTYIFLNVLLAASVHGI